MVRTKCIDLTILFYMYIFRSYQIRRFLHQYDGDYFWKWKIVSVLSEFTSSMG